MSDFKTLLAVGDIGDKKIVTIESDKSVIDGAKKMAQENTGSLLVTDAEGKIAGIVTESDIVRRGVADGANLSDVISHIMTPNPLTIPADESIFEARKIMTEQHVHHLVIVKDGVPVGTLTAEHVLGNG